MRTPKIIASIAIAALLSTPVHAQHMRADAPLPPAVGATPVERGVAAQVGVTLRFGGARAERAALHISAGPDLRLADGQRWSGGQYRAADTLRFDFVPQERAQFSLAGQPVATHYFDARLAAAEEGEGGGVPTVALVAGGVLLAVGLAYLVALDRIADCDPGDDCS